MSVSEAAARQAIVECYRELGRLRLNVGAAGNVSVRSGAGMLITPTGVPPEELAEDAVVAAGLDGSHAGPLRPSSEWAMHAAVYQRLPDAGAVIHGHPDAASPSPACAGRCRLSTTWSAVSAATMCPDRCIRPSAAARWARPPARPWASAPPACLAVMACWRAAQRWEKPSKRRSGSRSWCGNICWRSPAGEPVLLTPQEIALAGERYRDYGRNAGAQAQPAALERAGAAFDKEEVSDELRRYASWQLAPAAAQPLGLQPCSRARSPPPGWLAPAAGTAAAAHERSRAPADRRTRRPDPAVGGGDPPHLHRCADGAAAWHGGGGMVRPCRCHA